MFVDLCHALDGRMTVRLVDSVEDDARYLIVLANRLYGFVDFFLQSVVQDKVDVHIRVSVGHERQHLGHGRTEREEVFLCPALVFVFADGRACPGIVRSSEDEDDVRTSQVGHAGHERTVGIIGKVGIPTLVSGVADGSSRVRIVDTQVVAIVLDELVPPCLAYGSDVGVEGLGRVEIPYDIRIRLDKTLEGGVRVAQDGNGLDSLRSCP